MLCVCRQDDPENIDLGMDYMVQAADAGDRGAMIYVAKAFETGNLLGKRRWVGNRDVKKSFVFFEVKYIYKIL